MTPHLLLQLLQAVADLVLVFQTNPLGAAAFLALVWLLR